MKALSEGFLLWLLALGTVLAQTPPRQASTPAPATKKAGAAPAKTAARRTVTVTVTTDAPCSFSVDGKTLEDLRVGEPRQVPLSLIEHKLEAVSLSASQDRWVGAIDLSKTDTEPVVHIELLPVQTKRLEEERKAAQQRAIAFAGVQLCQSVLKRGMGDPLAASPEHPVRILLARPAQGVPSGVNSDYTQYNTVHGTLEAVGDVSMGFGTGAMYIKSGLLRFAGYVILSEGVVTFTDGEMQTQGGPAEVTFTNGSQCLVDKVPFRFDGKTWRPLFAF